ncbi:conserved membrane hypothetical protein [Bosea sp. 62]|uniref:DUF898 family protein n=1 Tax=unclassified Bosea (in: a-proteobacteria) TaxID=2653178 RepID=UPI00125A98C5|nr:MULTISPECIES: DUF898 family protein [unclassified Bosea (in: a-proteobacteria)]CAD5259101.1 conserved membrane hypothetical protein [Bosea sp. 46]CAD5263523.1 conserved membrane hypothetical protein [Bosea sp. 21B]CAD5276748.1 conserved membrane hypothetical protein [Bosea sp. 7B]VVT59003.1 conserved membrane hypothetical protein [Bosea sp. EC-HK365B]VXB65051.1 conserved membrane hypothetical protein [Bosea sp. 29B]
MHQVVANPASPADQVTFSGERPVFRKLVTRGALLELVTFGFYRFWLATDIRRHLWSHTSVGGDPAEYTGRAKELLIGFLIALAILVPVYLAYFLIALEAERLQAFASLPLIVFFYLFTEFARYRARRYRVTRTLWRGLRFSMGGSGWSYSWRSGLWWLLVILSLGLALPWRLAALERFKMRHTAYGSLQGRFDGTGGGFFKRAWGLWLSALLAVVIVFATPILAQTASRSDALLPLILIVLFTVLSPFVYAAFKAIEWRWWVSGLRFGEVRFESSLAADGLNGCYWKVIGWASLFLLLFALWCTGAFLFVSPFIATGDNSQERFLTASQHPAMLMIFVIGYLLAALAVGTVIRLYLNRDVWRLVAQSTVVHNLSAAGDVTGQGEAVGAVGEGLADGLDVAGF